MAEVNDKGIFGWIIIIIVLVIFVYFAWNNFKYFAINYEQIKQNNGGFFSQLWGGIGSIFEIIGTTLLDIVEYIFGSLFDLLWADTLNLNKF